MLVAFWGPVHGQVATTANMIAISSVLAMDYDMPILLAHSHFERSTLEHSFAKLRQHRGHSILEDAGIDEIERLHFSGLLTPEKVRECADRLIENRLDVITGTSTDEQSFLDALPQILEAGNKFYKITMFDVSAGSYKKPTNVLLQLADLVVVNLNQNLHVLDSFFRHEDYPEELRGKKVVYCLGHYQAKSVFTAKRIASMYGIEKGFICTVPSFVPYLDALNQGDAPLCFIRWGNIKRKPFELNETVQFMDALRTSAKCLLRTAELNPQVVGT